MKGRRIVIVVTGTEEGRADLWIENAPPPAEFARMLRQLADVLDDPKLAKDIKLYPHLQDDSLQ